MLNIPSDSYWSIQNVLMTDTILDSTRPYFHLITYFSPISYLSLSEKNCNPFEEGRVNVSGSIAVN